MLIKDLIEKLKLFPQDLPVLVDGYEGGYTELATIKETKVELNVHGEDYYGPHDETPNASVRVIVLRR